MAVVRDAICCCNLVLGDRTFNALDEIKKKTGSRKFWFRFDYAHAHKVNNGFLTCVGRETKEKKRCLGQIYLIDFPKICPQN